MFLEIIKFFVYSAIIVGLSKFLLAPMLRKLAELLNLSPKSIGKITGYATSMPELLTIAASSASGLIQTSIYNVISSNVINFIQYLMSIIRNKNWDKLRDRGIFINLILVVITILLPIVMVGMGIDMNIFLVLVFIGLYILFTKIIDGVHKMYLQREDERLEREIAQEIKLDRRLRWKAREYVIILLITVITLFIVGDNLGNTLEILCGKFNVPEWIVGILLGFITSIPELITFFESQKHHNKNSNKMLGVIETTNNLLTSNMCNLFLIQSIATVVYYIFG